MVEEVEQLARWNRMTNGGPILLSGGSDSHFNTIAITHSLRERHRVRGTGVLESTTETS